MSLKPRVVTTAWAVTIGAEILSGKVHDTNSYELAKALRRLGIELLRIVVVPDDIAQIEAAVREARRKADVVFTSGGIGPTHDDKTLAGVAQALDRPLLANPSLAIPIPAGSELVVLGNPKWPTVVAEGVWMLPGIPELFRMKLAVLGEYLRGPAPFFSRSLFLDADEPEIVEHLNETVARHPNVEVGSYPAWNHSRYRTQVTFDSRDETSLLNALEELESRVRTRIVSSDESGGEA